MSKKKKAAKEAAAQSRKEMLTRRTGDAVKAFREDFPSPYVQAEEEEAERQLCGEVRAAAVARAKDDELAGELFVELSDGSIAFQSWTVDLRDELAKRHESFDEAETRARFLLAHLWLAERGDDPHPEILRVGGQLFRTLPLEVPTIEDPYASQEALEADLALVDTALRAQYGDKVDDPEFGAPVYVPRDGNEDGDDDPVLSPWAETLHARLVEKYGSEEAAEPYWTFLTQDLADDEGGHAVEGGA
jgi:hypothetical protein